ncbi:hypothetical protein DCCM_2922 [Desulfocucumis palustris]|uniref:Uncharacterized protein n=1 Tax=Desulfocucumis palustris TaxID=1898651 RepID=A0A2L2XIR7_9FIRM|nr:hypothetical protein DCCM_2922 [Desulfocucumis palustris]
MYKKTCPNCAGDSYSASSARWICPYCKTDLSRQKPLPAGSAPGITTARNNGETKALRLIPGKG